MTVEEIIKELESIEDSLRYNDKENTIINSKRKET